MSMDERAYWIWLQHAFGAGSPKPSYIGKRYQNVADFFAEGERQWVRYDFINEKECMILKSFTPKQAEAQLEYAQKVDQQVITWGCAEYPQTLRQLEDPPAVLYLKGELPDFDNTLSIAIVGSRKAEAGAVKTAELISYELSRAGVVVVSGGALGIDGAAHRGAMRGTTPTACILACGIDFPYLMENQMLRGRVVEKGGTLLTEYPPGTPVYKGTFVVRNRLMSGLCQGLLVVCSSEKGGTMLTVRHATRQNKDIFAVPGNVNDPLAQGTNALIRDGVKPVLSVKDILEEYENRYQRVRASPEPLLEGIAPKAVALVGVSAAAKRLMAVLQAEPLHLSQLMGLTGLRASQTQAAAMELEVLGHLKSYSGQRYGLYSKKE